MWLVRGVFGGGFLRTWIVYLVFGVFSVRFCRFRVENGLFIFFVVSREFLIGVLYSGLVCFEVRFF